MADVIMPKSTPCQFDRGWSGICKKPSTNGWCTHHENALCCSCGAKAVRNCDATMGAMCCGATLCADCQHAEDGTHVTEARLKELEALRSAEEAATVASRTSPAQRMHDKLGVPLNLLELLKVPAQGYELRRIFWLELDHGLMGVFPAIYTGTREIVFAADPLLLIRAWKRLEPQKSRMGELMGYVHTDAGIAYPIFGSVTENREGSIPHRLLTEKALETPPAEPVRIRWAPGLIGGGISAEDFERLIRQAEEQLRQTA